MDMCPSQQKRWSRPSSPLLNSLQDTIIFQQIDIDSYVGEPVQGWINNNITIPIILCPPTLLIHPLCMFPGNWNTVHVHVNYVSNKVINIHCVQLSLNVSHLANPPTLHISKCGWKLKYSGTPLRRTL